MPKHLIKEFLSNANILVILVLIYGLFACCFQYFVDYNSEIQKLISGLDFFITTILFFFFVEEFIGAKKKRDFLKYGWVILLSSMPLESYFAHDYSIIIRGVRLLLLVWVLYSARFRARNFESNTLITTIMVCMLIVIISTILILQVENVPGGKIKTAEDALYWAFITISTVGYGDLYPVTGWGRLITVVLIFSGVSMFISAAGSFAAWISRGRGNA